MPRIGVRLAILLACVLGARARAEVLRVPSEYSTIQSAIDAAAIGDVVLVAPGSYSGAGNVDLDFHGVDLVCRSEAGARSTILQVGPPVGHRAFHLTNGESRAAVIGGFTIVGGAADDGGAIACRNASPTIRDCLIDQCRAGRGGGLFFEASSAWVERVTVTRCRASYDGDLDQNGGALYLLDSNVDLEDCTFSGNLASGFPYTPAALFLRGGGTLRRCVVSGNEGIGISADRVLLDHCVAAFNDRQEIDVVTTAEIEGSIIRDTCDASDVHLQPGATATIACTMLIPDKVEGSGTVQYLDPPIPLNPNFCDIPNCPSIPSVDGNFAVGPDSPARPENNPCGQFLGAIEASSCDPAAVGGPGGSWPEPDLAIELRGARPNPCSRELAIDFRLREAGRVRIRLLSPSGRSVATLDDQSRAKGEQTWIGQLPGISGSAAAGVYLLELSTAGRTATTPIVVLPR